MAICSFNEYYGFVYISFTLAPLTFFQKKVCFIGCDKTRQKKNTNALRCIIKIRKSYSKIELIITKLFDAVDDLIFLLLCKLCFMHQRIVYKQKQHCLY